MSAAGTMLRKVSGGYAHWCPGCSERHFIATEAPRPNAAWWTFDGDLERPTFGPSVCIRSYDGDHVVEVCHYFIRSGQIEFCADSTHALAGQTVQLPPWPA